MNGERLGSGFFDRPVAVVARELLGCTLAHGETSGVIVETEAYHEIEPACHAHIGPTSRTHVLFGAAGTVYVYRSYGIHALVNIVCQAPGIGAAVLVRALEPVDGIALMRERRGPRVRDAELCNGPGKLTQALGIELDLNQSSVVGGPIAVFGRPAGVLAPGIDAGPRIGITKAAAVPWRFSVTGSRWVSKPWPASVARRAAAARLARP